MNSSPVLALLVALGMTFPITGIFIYGVVKHLSPFRAYVVGSLITFWQILSLVLDFIVFFVIITTHPNGVETARVLTDIWNNGLCFLVSMSILIYFVSLAWNWIFAKEGSTVSKRESDVLTATMIGCITMIFIYFAWLVASNLLEGMAAIPK